MHSASRVQETFGEEKPNNSEVIIGVGSNGNEALGKYKSSARWTADKTLCYSWLDSMVAVYLISGRGSYKQFVANQVRLIQGKSYMETRRNEEKPRRHREERLSGRSAFYEMARTIRIAIQSDDWPNEVTVEVTEETEAEAKQKSGEVLKVVTQIEDKLNELLSKYSFW